jgi:hypothetical protein
MGPQEGSVGSFLMGPAFLGSQSFPERYAVLGEAFLYRQSSRMGGGASGVLPPGLVAPRGAVSS